MRFATVPFQQGMRSWRGYAERTGVINIAAALDHCYDARLFSGN